MANSNQSAATVESIGEELLRLDLDRQVLSVVAKRKYENKSRDHNSIVENCLNDEHTETDITSSIERLLIKGKLGSRQYNGRIVYRVLNEDLESSASHNSTEYESDNDEFVEFKTFVLDSIKEIHKELHILKNNKETPPLPPTSKVDLKYVVESKDVIIGLLKEEVKHLREVNSALISSFQSSKVSPPTKSNYHEHSNAILNDDLNGRENIIKTIDQWQKPKKTN